LLATCREYSTLHEEVVLAVILCIKSFVRGLSWS